MPFPCRRGHPRLVAEDIRSAVPDCGLMLEPPGSASKENVRCEGGQTSIGRLRRAGHSKAQATRFSKGGCTMNDATRGPTLGTFVHQELDFRASPERVYEALLDEKQFAAFSRSPAQIQREAGGGLGVFGGGGVGGHS